MHTFTPGDKIAVGSPQWYLREFELLTKQMLDTTRRKNADYSGTNGHSDAFANFRTTERIGIAATETGIMVRLSDKLARVASLLTPGHIQQVKDEAIEDTCLDGANYFLILALYLKAKRLQTTPEETPF